MIDMEVIDDLELRIIRVHEDATIEDFQDLVKSSFLGQVTRNLIWVLLPEALQRIDTKHLQSMSEARTVPR